MTSFPKANDLQVVILAAGQGKRMYSDLPKILHKLAGKMLLQHVVETAMELAQQTAPIVIYGHQGELVKSSCAHLPVRWLPQTEQLGTGHALLQALPHLCPEKNILILYGDVPLISKSTLENLLQHTHPEAVGLLTAIVEAPAGYGRIKRNSNRDVIGIVEEKDANETERTIQEINTGIYYVQAAHLKKWLPLLKAHNAQGEYYLTDIIALAVQEKCSVQTVFAHPDEIFGVNDQQQLARLERIYQKKIVGQLLLQGVTLADPQRIDVRGQVTIGRNVFIDINVLLIGRVIIGDNCIIGAHSILQNVELKNSVEIKPYSFLEGAVVGNEAKIGPYTRIRPQTTIADHVHIGNFVEVKNSSIAAHTKANHLSYLGDSQIGEAVNIGAGTITCNYDGERKHRTTIGDRVQIGSNSALVAPITIEHDAYVAAATTLRNNVPARAFAFNPRSETLRLDWRTKKLLEKGK